MVCVLFRTRTQEYVHTWSVSVVSARTKENSTEYIHGKNPCGRISEYMAAERYWLRNRNI